MRLGRGWRPGQVGSGGASTPSAGGSAAGRRRNGMKIIPMDYRLTGGVALYLALSHTWGSLPLSLSFIPFIPRSISQKVMRGGQSPFDGSRGDLPTNCPRSCGRRVAGQGIRLPQDTLALAKKTVARAVSAIPTCSGDSVYQRLGTGLLSFYPTVGCK